MKETTIAEQIAAALIDEGQLPAHSYDESLGLIQRTLEENGITEVELPDFRRAHRTGKTTRNRTPVYEEKR